MDPDPNANPSLVLSPILFFASPCIILCFRACIGDWKFIICNSARDYQLTDHTILLLVYISAQEKLEKRSDTEDLTEEGGGMPKSEADQGCKMVQ